MTLQLRQIQLKNFRCFESQTLSLEKPLVLIEGENGSGKTTLLEALHYLCYLRSFRTHLPRDMVAFEQDNFFIRVTLETSAPNEIAQAHEIQAGFTAKRRLVKVDNKAICSYKELMDYYRVVTLTEDDLSLITGGPEERRNFLDQALLLDNPDYIETLRRLRATTQQRNALLQAGRFSNDSYLFWTEQLWQQSCEIQRERAALLTSFEQEISRLVEKHLTDGKNDYPCTITCTYKPKKMNPEQDFSAFLEAQQGLQELETRWGRSLFGAHLDDFSLNFRYKKSKSFASRGQQKLIAVLLKIAQIKRLSAQRGPVIFLLDDFMTDFDEERSQQLLSALQEVPGQLIFTSPIQKGPLSQKLLQLGAQRISLTK